jgi:glyoxylase-like metal-dependent hydrolase (beta-lactamase superfamily II)
MRARLDICTGALIGMLFGWLAAPAAAAGPGWHLIPGGFEPGRSPDGNSIFLDAPQGLILVDTGRHPEHQAKLLAYARARGRPIVAIVNTHWHLDHSGGNAEIRAAFPRAGLYASEAVEGALKGFLPRSRAEAEAYLASGKAPAAQAAEIRGDFAAMDDPASLRPTHPVSRSERIRIGGRLLQVNLAPFAATEGDVWLYDPKAKLVVAGDLVVAAVPFMDTACAEGWRKALDAIAARPFETLIPGHGAPMTRAQFMTWRSAYSNLLDCAASDRSRDACIAGWKTDAAIFVPDGESRIDAMVGYYIDSRLRAAPEERLRYCKRQL